MNSPKVAVLLPIYKPNIDWLIEQLVSVNEQTYGNMEFFVYLDDPEDATDYAAILQEHITKMPFTLQKGEKNLGSNKAFEKLTYMATEKGGFKYIAFCDQDDIWLPEKIAVLVDEAEKNDLDLVCSDMEVIDEKDKKIHDRFTEITAVEVMERKILITNIIRDCIGNQVMLDILLQFNLFTGCSMLASTRVAYEALPFSQYEWYDHWLAAYVAGTSKKIGFYTEPLLKRRFHQNNQTVAQRNFWIKEKEARINFVDELKIALKNKMNINDEWILERAYFQFVGELYLMERQDAQKYIYRVN